MSEKEKELELDEEQVRKEAEKEVSKREMKEIAVEAPAGASTEEVMELAMKKLAELHPGFKVKSAPREKVSFYRKEIDTLMSCFGFDGVLTTDWSRLGDFTITDEEIEEVSKETGLKMKREEHLWEIAMRMAIQQ